MLICLVHRFSRSFFTLNFCPEFFSRTPEEFPGKISFVLTDLIKQLRNLHSETVEGIFSPDSDIEPPQQYEIKCFLNEGRIKQWARYTNPHVVGAVLRNYFSENCYTNPLFPVSQYERIIDACEAEDDQEVAAKISPIINSFSKERRYTIAFLFNFLKDIAAHEKENKMPVRKLATAFASYILLSEQQTSDSVSNSSSKSRHAFSRILKLYSVLFQDYKFKEWIMSDEDIERYVIPPLGKLPPPLHVVVKVVKAEGLPRMDLLSKSDPYVYVKTSSFSRFYLTKTKQDNHEPEWNETFKLDIRDRHNDLLILKIYDEDNSGDELISTVEIPIDCLKKGISLSQWFMAQPAEGISKGGRIFVELSLEN